MISWPSESKVDNEIFDLQRIVIEKYIDNFSVLLDQLSNGKMQSGKIKKVIPIVNNNIIEYCLSIIELKYSLENGKVHNEDILLVLGTPALSLNSLSARMGITQNIVLQNYDVRFSIADISKMRLAFSGLKFNELSSLVKNVAEAIKIFSPESKLILQTVHVNSNSSKTILIVLQSIINKVKSLPFVRFKEVLFDKLKLETTLESTIRTFIYYSELVIQEEIKKSL